MFASVCIHTVHRGCLCRLHIFKKSTKAWHSTANDTKVGLLEDYRMAYWDKQKLEIMFEYAAKPLKYCWILDN